MHLITLDIDKSIIPNSNISYFLNPDYVYVPILKSNLLVRQDEFIYKGKKIENKIYSPISGKAIGIKPLYVLNNSKNTLVIANDFREMTKINKSKKKIKTVNDLLKLLESKKELRLLNLFKSSKIYDNIVIKVIDDNPYVYNRIFLLKESLLDILEILDNISLIYQTKESNIVIRNSDSHIIQECMKHIGSYPKTRLTLVNDEYLLGQDRFLQEKLKFKKRTLFLDIFDILKLKSLINNEERNTQIITISGDAIKENKVMWVKKYTLLSDVLDRFIEITYKDYDIIINGLMTGFRIKDARNFVISDEVECINIMKKVKLKKRECIKCGKCIIICPVGVNPINLKNKNKCLDCGLCSYICPCNINLREFLRK